jgi:Bacterial membrane protein YfhO
VSYAASAFDLAEPGLTLRQQFGTTRIYENEAARPRAWLDGGAATIEEWSPNRIMIQADGPGLLVLSEVAYPGWQARVDGQPVPIEAVESLLRGLSIGPGAHNVVFEFRPWTVYTGALFTLLGLASLMGIWLRKR